MSLRTTRQRRTHGPDAIDYQLAEHDYHQDRQRSETRVISTFGRADQVDPDALRRLAQSILRVANDDRIDLPARTFSAEVGIDDLEQVYDDGVLSMAHAVWEELGLGARLRAQMAQDGCPAPHETALFAMTAHRLVRPASTLACDEHWLAEDVYWPDVQGLALEHRYRALDCLLPHIDSLAPELCFRPADLFHADVDLVFWDTPTLYCAVDAEDVWHDQAIPARRTRGHNTEGRDGHLPVVVGLALTRDGWPVRAWVLPGHTADGTTNELPRSKLRGILNGKERSKLRGI